MDLPIGSPILLDGRCYEREWDEAARIDLGDGVTLLGSISGDRVQLCIIPTVESLGTLDLYLQLEPGTPLINLHVSAQVGERVMGEQGWSEWDWGNHTAWYGVPVPFRGLQRAEDGDATLIFENGTDREMSLELSRFGPLPWRTRWEVRALGADRSGAVDYPVAEQWLVLRPAR